MDLSVFDRENLFSQLEGRQLVGFFNEDVFNDKADFQAQTPSIYPLGTLHYEGPAGRGMGQRWATEDDSIWVEIDSDGIITWVRDAV